MLVESDYEGIGSITNPVFTDITVTKEKVETIQAIAICLQVMCYLLSYCREMILLKMMSSNYR